MIDIKLYEQNSDLQNHYLNSLRNRGEETLSFEKVIKLNQERKKLIHHTEQLIHQRRKIEKEFFIKKSSSDKKKDQNKKLSDVQQMGSEISDLQKKLKTIEEDINNILLNLPNTCHLSVPIGSSSEDNQIVKKSGQPPSFSFPAKSHLELGAKNIDIKRATKVAGARFSFLKGPLAKLERALAAFMLETHTKKNGYEELHTPFMIHRQSLIHTGQLPKFEEDLFRVDHDHYYLLPTAEVSLTNFFSNEILQEKDLPIKFTSYSPCFRSEAGSYGQDTKGLIRQHQFTKVELVIFSHPQNSYEQLENLTHHASMILEDLELPYRVANLCAGDLGFCATKCYDLEVWMPSEKTYREISSCSNCEDYQARRGKIRFRSSENSSPQFVHTLNGSGLAVGRTLMALLENHQDENGNIYIPKKLQPYVDNQTILKLK